MTPPGLLYQKDFHPCCAQSNPRVFAHIDFSVDGGPRGCATDWGDVPSLPEKESIYQNVTLNVIVYESGAFGRWLDHDSGALMNGMNPFIKHRPP